MATRANAESVLIGRVGPFMTKAGLDGSTVDGTNTDLNEPLAFGLQQAGYTVSDVTLVDDSDVSAVTNTDWFKMLDYAEYRLLASLMTNITSVDVKVGPRELKGSQFGAQLRARFNALGTLLERLYGFGQSALVTGVINLDFACRGEDDLWTNS